MRRTAEENRLAKHFNIGVANLLATAGTKKDIKLASARFQHTALFWQAKYIMLILLIESNLGIFYNDI